MKEIHVSPRPRRANRLAKMREDWDDRAKEDCLYWVWTVAGRRSSDLESYYETGKQDAANLTSAAFQTFAFNPRGKRLLEIGCGVGRLFPGFDRLGFQEIWGVDVSPEMIERGRKWCPVTRAHFVLVDGEALSGIESDEFDYCFSYNVFQHAPEVKVLWSNFREAYRALRPGGVFQAHFRGRRTRRERMLCLIPPRVRPVSQSTFRLLALRWLRDGQLRSKKTTGSDETWDLGVAVHPSEMARRLAEIGFRDVEIVQDSDYRNGTRHWAFARKPEAPA